MRRKPRHVVAAGGANLSGRQVAADGAATERRVISAVAAVANLAEPPSASSASRFKNDGRTRLVDCIRSLRATARMRRIDSR